MSNNHLHREKIAGASAHAFPVNSAQNVVKSWYRFRRSPTIHWYIWYSSHI